MDQLNCFFNSANSLLSDPDFAIQHVLSPNAFTRKRCLTLRNTWWCLMAHGSSSLQSEVPLFRLKFENEFYCMQGTF